MLVQRAAAPRETDARPGTRSKGALPALAPRGGAREITRRRRNRVERGLEYQRQTHERTPAVDHGQRVAMRHDAGDARQTPEQSGQCGLHLENDVRTQRGHARSVATELQRIAEALFPMQQHRPAGDGFGTRPAGRREIPSRLGALLLDFPAPFVFGPGSLPPPREKESDRPVEMRRGVAGIQSQRTLEARQRIVAAVQFREHRTPIAESRRIGFQLDGPVAIRERSLQPVQPPQRDRAANEALPTVRVETHRLIETPERLLEALQRQETPAPPQVAYRIAGRKRERLIVARDRIGGAVESALCAGPALESSERIGPGGQRRIAGGNGLGMPPESSQCRRAVQVELGPIRTQRRRHAAIMQCRVEASEFDQGRCTIAQRLEASRVERERAVIACDRLLRAVKTPHQDACIDECRYIALVVDQCPLVAAARILDSTKLRERKAAERVRLGGIDAEFDRPLRARERLAPATQFQEHGRPAHVRADGGGSRLRGPPITRGSLLATPQALERVAAVDMRRGKTRLQREGAVVAAECLIETVRAQQRVAEVGVHGRFRPVARDAREQRNRGMVLPRLNLGDSERMHDVEVIGRIPQHLPVRAPGKLQLAALVRREASFAALLPRGVVQTRNIIQPAGVIPRTGVIDGDHATPSAGRVRAPRSAIARRRSAATRSSGTRQSPRAAWRYSLTEAYQGLSEHSRDQRQSGWKGSNTQVGRPNAPARCATLVSTLMMRSRHAHTAAVSPKSRSSPDTSRISGRLASVARSASRISLVRPT